MFFGEQHCATDFLLRDELAEMQRSGLLTHLSIAFSRDQAERVYVQHRLLEQADTIWQWLGRGAHLYLCGDAARMAVDVDRALHRVVATAGGLSDEDAADYWKELARCGRYQKDVY